MVRCDDVQSTQWFIPYNKNKCEYLKQAYEKWYLAAKHQKNIRLEISHNHHEDVLDDHDCVESLQMLCLDSNLQKTYFKVRFKKKIIMNRFLLHVLCLIMCNTGMRFASPYTIDNKTKAARDLTDVPIHTNLRFIPPSNKYSGLDMLQPQASSSMPISETWLTSISPEVH